MTDQPDITARLATALREARRARGLSLDAVAKLSGVSRSMVSQIERGESSPTVATLWNLTRALQVDFAGLLDAPAPPAIEVVRAAAAPTIAGRGTGVTIRILSPPETAGSHEVYDLDFAPGGRLVSEAHGPGWREHLTVIAGSLHVASGDAAELLHPGDTARYPADRPHRIESTGGPARALLIVQGA
ncbi:MAG: helix-turn-helix domain-containing protein [Gemmobacter sp.]|uniref:helix-turn-helix domain-containing protein n=1 Tax=Gemmobacter sp. TaxID=1898957 RepID=UPI0039195EAB